MRFLKKFLRGFRRAAPVRNAAGVAGALAVAASVATVDFLGVWEGHRNHAYLDRIASPPVWTICGGETRGVKRGDYKTDEECAAMLARGVADFRAGLSRCLPTLPSLPEGVQVALTSWSYNVGLGAACGSTLVRLARAGDLRGACNQLPRWDRAGGKRIPGLSNRRGAERALCLGALK